MNRKPKLELLWVGKDIRPRLEPRILLEDLDLSYHALHRVSDADLFDNRLIFGDNLLALKALEQEFSGRVKCIYIDPPFNTGEALEHYDDGVEHSIWLGLLRDRIELLHRLLTREGSLFVHIDDNELAYLIVILDEVFGRSNRIATITFKQGAATGHKAINPGLVTTSNFVLAYAKDRSFWVPNRVFTARGRDPRYATFIVNRTAPPNEWQFETLTAAFAKSLGLPPKALKKAVPDYENALDAFVLANATHVVRLARPDYEAVGATAREAIDQSRYIPDEVLHLRREEHSDMYFIRGERILFYSDKLKLIDGRWVAGEPLTTIWDDLLSNNLHNEGAVLSLKAKNRKL